MLPVKTTNKPVLGMTWMLLEAASMAASIAAVRKLSGTVPLFEIVFFRAVFGLFMQAPWAIRAGRTAFHPPRARRVWLRSFLVLAALVFWYTAIGAMPISDAVALQFTLPLFAIIGAGLVLGETVGARRWTAAALGFCGALVIIRPGFIEFDPMALVVLVSAALVASVHLVTKKLAGVVSGQALAFHMHIFMLPIAAIAMIPGWLMPGWADLPWLLAVALFSTVAHIFATRAMAVADASLVAPVDFMRLPLAALFGWILFRETSDMWTWIGAAFICANAIYLARHEATAGGTPS